MNYIRLNPQYIIRNEKCCSYIVKLEQQVDNDVQGNSGNIFVVPPVDLLYLKLVKILRQYHCKKFLCHWV